MANMDFSCITKIPSALCTSIAGAATSTVNAAKPVVQAVASKIGAVFQKVVPYLAAAFAFTTSNVGLSVILFGAAIGLLHLGANTNDDCEVITYVALGLFAAASATSLFLGKGFAATRIAALRA